MSEKNPKNIINKSFLFYQLGMTTEQTISCYLGNIYLSFSKDNALAIISKFFHLSMSYGNTREKLEKSKQL